MLVGYIRVSTDDQNLSLQKDAPADLFGQSAGVIRTVLK